MVSKRLEGGRHSETGVQMVVRYYVGAGDGTGPVEEQPNFPVPSQSTF